MAVARPGVQKLNIPKLQSPKASIAANLGSASRSTGVSYGIFAQRTLTGSGIHLNNRMFNGASISATRHALNDNRMALFNNIGMPHHCNHNQGNTTMNKFMAGMMAMNMLAQMGAQTAAIIKEAKAEKPDKPDKKDGLGDGPAKTTQPKLLNDLNKLVTEANTKVSDFNAGYANTKGLSQAQQSITDVKALLSQVGINNVNISEISLSELNLTTASSLADIDAAIETIQNKDIASIDTLSGNLGSAISSIDEQLRTLSADTEHRAENATKISQLQSAKAKLETLRDTQLPELKTNLTAQKEKLSGIRTEKAEAMDKVYAQAQADDTKIGENNTEMTRLKGEIEKETDDKKKKKLIDKYNGLADANKGLQTGLKGLPSGTVNSKNETLTLNNINGAMVEHYTEPVKTTTPVTATPVTPNPVSGGGLIEGLGIGANGQIMPKLALAKDVDSCKIQQKVEVNGQQYTRISQDFFLASDGHSTISTEELKELVPEQPEQPEQPSFMFRQQPDWFNPGV